MVRVLKLDLEKRPKERLAVTHGVFARLVEHAVDLMNSRCPKMARQLVNAERGRNTVEQCYSLGPRNVEGSRKGPRRSND